MLALLVDGIQNLVDGALPSRKQVFTIYGHRRLEVLAELKLQIIMHRLG